MAAWSPEIANEFIRLAKDANAALTQMQLQKLVYIANGWNLAINDKPLTSDEPLAWDYGPVYRELSGALRRYGRESVTREIRNGEYMPGMFMDDPEATAVGNLTQDEKVLIGLVYKKYGKFHAYQLSALTHKGGTPWKLIYGEGEGRNQTIHSNLIRDHFVELATRRAA